MFLMLLLWLIGSTSWAALAINFANSNSSLLNQILSLLIGLFGLVTLGVTIFFPSKRNLFLSFHSLMFISVLVLWFSIEASNDRDWQTDVKKLAHATINNNLITVHNIRNFKYQSEFDYTPNYYDKTFDINQLQGVDLIAVYWMGPEIAHIMLSFDFGNNNHLAVSIEARKELNEAYSTIKGFFRQYELIYIVADERDVLGLRTHYRKNPPEQVYLYRLNSPLNNGNHLFLEYIDKINETYKKPSFYNTLFANCTNIIWLNAHVNPNRIPFSWKLILSGYVPEYLYEQNRLKSGSSFEELRNKAFINPLVDKQAISADYSNKIRP